MSDVIRMKLQDVVNMGEGGGSDEIWLPSVDAEGDLSWRKSSSSTPPETVNIKGPAGADGQNGQDGQDGANGLGVKSLAVDASNHLIITFDDDSTEDAGEIDVTVPIDDTTPASNKVYSSEKVEEKFVDNNEYLHTKIAEIVEPTSYNKIKNSDVMSKIGDDTYTIAGDARYSGLDLKYKIADFKENEDVNFFFKFKRNSNDPHNAVSFQLVFAIPGGQSSIGVIALAGADEMNFAVYTFTYEQLLAKKKDDTYIQIYVMQQSSTNPVYDFTESIAVFYGSTVEKPTLMQLRDSVYNPLNGKKVMFLGDSITALKDERSWVNSFLYMTGMNEVVDTAVVGAYLREFSDTVYDGDPKTSNDHNNVLGNQVQKIINNQYEAPDVIMIAIGTNGGISFTDEQLKASYYDENGMVALADLDKTNAAGAFRYCNEKLHNLYPNALICWCSPIQRSWQSSTIFDANMEQSYNLEKLTRWGSSYFIDTHSCGIRAANEINGGRGEYLVDGLHPNSAGAIVMARFNASAVASLLGVASRYLDVK